MKDDSSVINTNQGKTPKKVKKEIWDSTKDPIQEGEELVFDSSAYQMLHRAKVEWPCLSVDVLLRDRVADNFKNTTSWFP